MINWIDNVNASEVYNSDFGKKITDNSYVFNSAYTVTPWTRFTHIAVMTGMLPISDETYKPMRFSTDNSEVLNCVEKNGYLPQTRLCKLGRQYCQPYPNRLSGRKYYSQRYNEQCGRNKIVYNINR